MPADAPSPYDQPPPWQTDEPGGPAESGATSSTSDRTWAVVSHLGVFVTAWFLLGIVAPLVVRLTAGIPSAFVRRHATESLNFQLSFLLTLVVTGTGLGLAALLLGLLVDWWVAAAMMPVALGVLGLLLLFYAFVVIHASMRAWAGKDYRYPLTVRPFS